MKWYLLKQNRCPKCGADLEWRQGNYEKFFVCVKPVCDFKIGERKFGEISMEMNIKN